MNDLTEFLTNPIVGFIGYALSAVAAIIAISQVLLKQKALKKIEELNIQVINFKNENTSLKLAINQVDNNNLVSQGEKSQYFQDNSGSVTIDNRN